MADLFFEAMHKVVDSVRMPMLSRFAATYCSQCGKNLGPGNEGASSCCDHGACQALARGDACECDRTATEKGRSP